MDLRRGRIRLEDGSEQSLTSKERDLLAYLRDRDGGVVSREELLQRVWGYDPSVVSRAVDLALGRLRKKIEVDPANPEHLVTQYGEGYRLLAARQASVRGREQEHEALIAACSSCRLVTIVGVGGVGKTWLARQFAEVRGGLFVGLRHARDAGEIEAALRSALRLGARADHAELMQALLGQKLIVLDNFEQVVSQASVTVGRWLEAARGVCFVVTSRERLGLPAETLIELGPLAAPEAMTLLRGHAAVTLSDPDAEALLEATGRHPLAIELAAARLDLLSPPDLVRRLGASVQILTGVRTALAWSWSMLTTEEQRALSQCTVFVGGFDMSAAEAVLTPPDGGSVLEIVTSLRAKSLLEARSVDGNRRMDLHPLVRTFASEYLEDASEVRDRAADHFFEVALSAHRSGHGSAAVVALLHEVPNLLAAVHGEDSERSVNALYLLRPLWHRYGTYGQWRELAESCVERSAGLSGLWRGRALNLAADTCLLLGDRDQAAQRFTEALTVFQADGDPVGLAHASGGLGNIALWGGRHRDALGHYRAGLEAAKGTGRVEGTLHRCCAGVLADLGEWAEAEEHLESAIALHRRLRDAHDVIESRHNLATCWLATRRVVEAIAVLDEVVAYYTDAGDARGVAAARCDLSLAWSQRRRPEQGLEHARLAREALASCRQLPLLADTISCADGIAQLGLGRRREARDAFEGALSSRSSREQAVAMCLLAVVSEAPEANDLFERATELAGAPDFVDACRSILAGDTPGPGVASPTLLALMGALR